MLSAGRSDFVPRGVYQALPELKRLQVVHPYFTLEKTILIDTNLPLFYYVDPRKPHLAKRIEQGLTQIIEQNLLDSIFEKHFGYLEQSLQLSKRKVFNLY